MRDRIQAKNRGLPNEENNVKSNQLRWADCLTETDVDNNADGACMKLEKLDGEDPLRLPYVEADTDVIKEEPLNMKSFQADDDDGNMDPLISGVLQYSLRERKQPVNEKTKDTTHYLSHCFDNNEKSTLISDTKCRKAIQLERMRAFHTQCLLTETPEQTDRRRASDRIREERARSKKRDVKAIKIKAIKDTDPKQPQSRSSDTTVSAPPSSFNKQHRTRAERQRELRAKELPEETAARRMQQRIAQVKSRLLAQLYSTEKDWQAVQARKTSKMRQLRLQRRALETPEEAAERKKQQTEQIRLSRSRVAAIETPEEALARRVADRVNRKKRYAEFKAKETPEERVARNERDRLRRERYRERKKAALVAHGKQGCKESIAVLT